MAEKSGFSAAERAAMKERAAELKTTKKRGAKADLEPEVLAKIAEMPEADRVLAQRVHELVREVAPDLTPRLWYGMPAYAKDGKVLCFFQGAAKFEERYCTLGFSGQANLDKAGMWPTAYALIEMTEAVEKQIRTLLKRAIR